MTKHTITIELSDAEYDDLKRRAEGERRSVENMAEWIVTKAQPQSIPVYVYPQVYPQITPRPNWWYYTNTAGNVLSSQLQSRTVNETTFQALKASGE